MSSASLFSAFPALAQLSPTDLARLSAAATPVSLPNGTQLFKPGDACQAYLMVTHGCVQVRLMDDAGHRITLYRVEAGETCVLTTSCLMANAHYTAEGVAESDVAGFTLSPAAFRDLLASCEGFRQFVFSAFGQRLSDMMVLVNEVAFHRLDQRLADWLLRQPDETISSTHQQIADDLGTAREVVSRLLKDFERKGWISLSRGVIIRNRIMKNQCARDSAA